MGVYDTFGELDIQLKVGPCMMAEYAIGDLVEGITDGVYVGHDGVVVIKDGIFVAEFPHLVTTWGDIVEPETVLLPHDAVAQVVADFEKTS